MGPRRAAGRWNALLPHDRQAAGSGRVGEPESRYALPSRSRTRSRVREQPPEDPSRPDDGASPDASADERAADLPRRWRRMAVRPGTAVPRRVEQAGAEKTVYVVVPEADLHALREAINDGRQQAQNLSHRLLAKGPQHVRDFQLARHLREHLTRLLDWFDDET